MSQTCTQADMADLIRLPRLRELLSLGEDQGPGPWPRSVDRGLDPGRSDNSRVSRLVAWSELMIDISLKSSQARCTPLWDDANP